MNSGQHSFWLKFSCTWVFLLCIGCPNDDRSSLELLPPGCERDGDGAVLCDDLPCEELPNVFLCQDAGGETVERRRLRKDGWTGTTTPNCEVAGRVGLHASTPLGPGGELIPAGVAWAVAGASGRTDVWVAVDQVLRGLQQPDPDGTGPYPGTFEVKWQKGGVDVAATDDTGGNALPSARVGPSRESRLLEDFEKLDEQWRSVNRAFRFEPPAPPVVERVQATLKWLAPRDQECEASASFDLNWLPALEFPNFPDEVPIPDPIPGDDLEHQEDDRRSHVQREVASVVTPLRYFWSVPNVQGGCCPRNRGAQVIQFARAVLDSDDIEWLRRIKPWGLDVREEVKERARHGRRNFDPTFTNNPGLGDTQIDLHDGANPSVSHWDGPGMSEIRYRQLLLTPGTHRFHQQFFAFLVCESGRHRESHRQVRDRLVIKAVVYTVTWTFQGPVDGPDRVSVESRVNAGRDLACRHRLGDLLDANRLTNALRSPPPSELTPSHNHNAEVQDLSDLSEIRLP